MNPLHNRIRSDKTGRLMTFQAFQPSCVQVCRHVKSLRETSQLHGGAWVDCRFTGPSERRWFKSESWEYWAVMLFFFMNSPLLVLTRFWADQKWSEETNANSNIRKHIYRNTKKAFCVNFGEISGQKLEILFAVTWSLREFSAHASPTCRRTPSSWARPGMCALPTGGLFLWQFEILTSMPCTPARLRAARGRVTHCYSSCFSSSLLFLAFTFWFIHGSDLKGRSFALEEDLHLQRRQGVSSDPPLFMFCPVLACLSGSLLHGSLLLLCSHLLQLLQENPEVFRGSSSSITWVCSRANNQELAPTHGSAIKAPPTVHEVYYFMIVNFYECGSNVLGGCACSFCV